MDWTQNDDSMTDRRSSSGDIVQNIHGETVDIRTKRYMVSAAESSTDHDYETVHDVTQDDHVYVNSDRVSSIDFSKSQFSNSEDTKMSSGKTEVKKSSSYERLLLKGGKDLTGESRSDYDKLKKFSQANGRDHEKQNQDSARKLSESSESATAVTDTTTNELCIPANGNLLSFSIEDMTAFFRAMNVNELIVQRLQRKKLDGKKFSRLKDTVMEDIGIKNPIICYFRDRSKKDRLNFML